MDGVKEAPSVQCNKALIILGRAAKMAVLPPLHPILAVSLALLVVSAAYTDLRERRVPNWLTGAGVLLGLCLQAATGGWQGLWAGALGAGLALLVYVPLFALRAMGGGDVKLMAAIGAMAGPSHWALIFVLASLTGGVWAVLLLLSRGTLGQAVANALHVLAEALRLRAPWRSRPELDIRHPRALNVPHGAAIAIGTFASLVFVRP